ACLRGRAYRLRQSRRPGFRDCRAGAWRAPARERKTRVRSAAGQRPTPRTPTPRSGKQSLSSLLALEDVSGFAARLQRLTALGELPGEQNWHAERHIAGPLQERQRDCRGRGDPEQRAEQRIGSFLHTDGAGNENRRAANAVEDGFNRE